MSWNTRMLRKPSHIVYWRSVKGCLTPLYQYEEYNVIKGKISCCPVHKFFLFWFFSPQKKKERREMQTKKLVPHLILNSIYFGAYVNKQPKTTESNAVVLAKDNCTASNIYLRQDSVLFNQKHLQRIFCSTQMSTET